MIRVPSLKTLRDTFGISTDVARAIRQVLKGDVDPCSVSEAALTYKRQCYNPPENYLLKLTAINQILGTYGVEYVPKGSNARSPGFYYLNTGDTYDTTLVRMDGGTYRITSWGDIVERGSYA